MENLMPSFTIHNWKEFTITTNSGPLFSFCFTVSRRIRGKEFILHQEATIYKYPELALLKGLEFIEKNEKALKERFRAKFTDFCEEVTRNSKFFYEEHPEIDTRYFVASKIKIDQLKSS